MSQLKTTFTFIALILISSYAFSAKFYKWTDEDGNVYYSDKVPEGQENAEEVFVSASKPSTSKTPTGPQTGETKGSAPSDQSNQAEQEAKLKKYCDDVRKNISTLETGGKIQSVDSEGNKNYLDDQAQQEKLKQYKLEESARCQGI